LGRRFRLTALVAILVSLAAICPPALCDPEPPTSTERRIAWTVAGLLQRDHLTKRALDDEISRRSLKTFLRALDPWKLYFYQSDIDKFNALETQLDDLAKRLGEGYLEFAHAVFKTLLERVDERAAWVEELLATEHDFTVDEEMIRDRDLAEYAKDPAEARDKWRKRIKHDLLVLKADDTEGEEAVERLRKRYRSLFRRLHQTDNDELLEMYLTSLTSAFDPHTTYMSPNTLDNFEIAMRLELEGIGAALSSEDGETVVKKIIPGGAADRDGRLKVEDVIVGVGQGEDGEIEDVVNMKLRDVVDRIRGKRGTTVRLEVLSKGSPDRKLIRIVRDKIELKDSEARAEVFEEGRKPDGQPYKLGVIALPSFYMDMSGARRGVPEFKSTTRDVRRILERFNEQGVDAVILDLRENGGGSLQEAISLTGLFIEEGPIVQVKDADGRVRPYNDPDGTAVWQGPLVVLISKLSASASEILAGAIQDYQRGLIVGDRATHGKGTVQSLTDIGQQLLDLPSTSSNWGALKITMQQFYRPSGDSTQNRGVLADVELPSLTTHLDVAESDLDYPIPFDRVRPLQFDKLNYVDDALRDRLSYLSSQRRKQSEGFQKELEKIDRYLERKERKTVPLHEERFLAEMKLLDAEKEEKEALEESEETPDNGIERNFYLDEALAITLDYLQHTMVAHAK
jgi:carboxyl-terminal processing protease